MSPPDVAARSFADNRSAPTRGWRATPTARPGALIPGLFEAHRVLRQTTCRVPGHLRPTLLALADHGGPRSEGIFPSVGRLARQLGRSPRTVQRHLRKLTELGCLTVTPRPEWTNVYELHLDRWLDADAATASTASRANGTDEVGATLGPDELEIEVSWEDDAAPGAGLAGTTSCHPPAAAVTGGGDTVAPELSFSTPEGTAERESARVLVHACEATTTAAERPAPPAEARDGSSEVAPSQARAAVDAADAAAVEAFDANARERAAALAPKLTRSALLALWDAAWSGRYGHPYPPGLDDEAALAALRTAAVVQALAVHATLRATSSAAVPSLLALQAQYVAFVAAAFLRVPGARDALLVQQHPLRWLPRELPSLGTPWLRRAARLSPRAPSLASTQAPTPRAQARPSPAGGDLAPGVDSPTQRDITMTGVRGVFAVLDEVRRTGRAPARPSVPRPGLAGGEKPG